MQAAHTRAAGVSPPPGVGASSPGQGGASFPNISGASPAAAFGSEFGANFTPGGRGGFPCGGNSGRNDDGTGTAQRQQRQKPANGAPVFHNMASGESGSKPQQHNTLYDEKVAQSPQNQYDNANLHKGLEWVRGYLITRRWEMAI